MPTPLDAAGRAGIVLVELPTRACVRKHATLMHEGSQGPESDLSSAPLESFFGRGPGAARTPNVPGFCLLYISRTVCSAEHVPMGHVRIRSRFGSRFEKRCEIGSGTTGHGVRGCVSDWRRQVW